jgi:DNA invertase Pin-like site-specific DNA recombinase
MIYGYVRISTEMQNYDLQLNALKDCDKIYKETVSGTERHRKELNNLLSEIKPGDTLKVYKLDRLGRSTSHLMDIIEHLNENNIGFVSVTDNLDTTTAMGKMIFTVFAAFAEFERNLISERTKAGLQAVKAKGVKLGQPIKWTEKQIKQVIQMKSKGIKVSDISKAMNIPQSTIYHLLSIREM